MKKRIILITGFLILVFSGRVFGDSAASFWQKYFPIIDTHFDEYKKLLSKNLHHHTWLMVYRGEEIAGGGYPWSQEELDLIRKAHYLLTINTKEELRKFAIETCKWVLWGTCWLASEESGIPETSRSKFKESAEKIKSNPALKEIFNYEDIDKKLAILCMNKEELEKLRTGKSIYYRCGRWALDANWYAYFKTKEDGFRKAASLWGYEFYEFLSEIKNCCMSPAGGGMWPIRFWFYRKQTPVIPLGATVRLTSKKMKPGEEVHDQISLGEEFGLSTNGLFLPDRDVLRICGIVETESFSWYYPCATEYFEDPFIYLLDLYLSGLKQIKFIHKKSAPR